MSGWDYESEETKKKEFTKFAEGITKIRIIDDAPKVRWTHWMQKNQRSINCPGRDCPICDIRRKQKANKEPYTHPMARKFAMQILNRGTGKLEIMEQGVTFIDDLKLVREDLSKLGKNLIDVDIQVRRKGTTKDNTNYRLDIAEEYELTDIEKEIIKEKVDLEEYFAPNTPEQILRILNGEDWNEVMYNNDDKEVASSNDTEEYELS